MKAILVALGIAMGLASVTPLMAANHPAKIFDQLSKSAP